MVRGPAGRVIAGSRSDRQLRKTRSFTHDLQQVGPITSRFAKFRPRPTSVAASQGRRHGRLAHRPSWQLGPRVRSRAAACGQLQNPWTSPLGIGEG